MDDRLTGCSEADLATWRFADAARRLVAGRSAGMTSGAAPGSVLPEALEPLWLPVAVLWERFLRFDPAAPLWPDRDRFAVSSVRMRPLLGAFLRLTGSTAAAPDLTVTGYPAAGVSVGLAGQPVAIAAGMALAEQTLEKRFGQSLVNHRTWLLSGRADLETGLAMEAAMLAGQYHLHRLCVMTDIPPGSVSDPAADMTLNCFQAAGWSVRRIRPAGVAEVAAVLAATLRSRRPVLLAFEGRFPAYIPQPPQGETSGAWVAVTRRGTTLRRSWLRRLTRHRQRAVFERATGGGITDRFTEDWRRLWRGLRRPEELNSDGYLALEFLERLIPESVFLTSAMDAGHAALRPLPVAVRACGAREGAMAGFLNGMTLHGGVRGFGVAALGSADRLRPALRFAAITRQRILCVLAEGAAGAGGVLWQQPEQLAGLRAMKDLAVFRPGSRREVVACWEGALRWEHGPAVMIISPSVSGDPDTEAGLQGGRGDPGRGGYILREAEGGLLNRSVTLLTSGGEAGLALETARLLEARGGCRVAVVSLPCWEIFALQDRDYRDGVLGVAPRAALEAASGFGWERWTGGDGLFIGPEENPRAELNPESVLPDLSAEHCAGRIAHFLRLPSRGRRGAEGG
ncbi:transketolase [Acetobacter sp. AN02]|uniref:transketolase-like TK C-terminal-containing protein n=1 Tax=Acetobacter sp. AN02 TaxID=2894186 RepID=UPI0024343E6B|nr:transketolase [Acetobacter sp. AN02]MDG6095091.1 transketolase [Acetobacter sp. AN02]